MLEDHKQIRAAVDAYQGLANELIERGGVEPRASRIRRRQRLGALLNYYCRAA